MNEVLKCILERRSIRRYRPEQIMEGDLDAILRAGLYAPNAGSRQSAVIAVCQNAQINAELGRINKAAYHGVVSEGYISRDQPSIADDAALPSGFYSAPTVLTLFAQKDLRFGAADCCVAAENMMLVAHSLGIGSCMVGRAEDTFASERGQQIQAQWGIGADCEAKMHVLLGYPASAQATAKPRKEHRVMRIQ